MRRGNQAVAEKPHAAIKRKSLQSVSFVIEGWRFWTICTDHLDFSNYSTTIECCILQLSRLQEVYSKLFTKTFQGNLSFCDLLFLSLSYF